MKRSSPTWLLIAFCLGFIGVGFRYWQLPDAQAALPGSLYGPGLVAVGVVAMMARGFGLARFWKVWLLMAASVPAAVLVRVVMETQRNSPAAGAWPADLAIAIGLGLACALVGTAIGSLFLLRSSQRPA